MPTWHEQKQLHLYLWWSCMCVKLGLSCTQMYIVQGYSGTGWRREYLDPRATKWKVHDRKFIFHTLHQSLFVRATVFCVITWWELEWVVWCVHTKENSTDGTCRMHREDEKYVQSLHMENYSQRLLGNLDVYGAWHKELILKNVVRMRHLK